LIFVLVAVSNVRRPWESVVIDEHSPVLVKGASTISRPQHSIQPGVLQALLIVIIITDMWSIGIIDGDACAYSCIIAAIHTGTNLINLCFLPG